MRPVNDALAAEILEAGKREFFAKGFQKASMRAIAASIGVTTGAIYRYYASKEAIFQALVAEPAEALYEWYRDYSAGYSQNGLQEQLTGLDEVANIKVSDMFSYIYNHYDAFKLIACCAEGTQYADYVERLTEVETKSGIVLVRMMQEEKGACRDMDDMLVHIISSTYFKGVFEVIAHDPDEDTALEHMGALRDFYTAGWYQILGIG